VGKLHLGLGKLHHISVGISVPRGQGHFHKHFAVDVVALAHLDGDAAEQYS
jgi:hypothetical protein